ncbi:MAG: hypothetical protein GSR79_01605 [Desulfurococcales archaeon]|nr:hypothetical protein [Desulfurococcales archaeon]
MEVEVVVEAEVRPTEDSEKVRKAINNIFEGEVRLEGNIARLECRNLSCLARFHLKLRQQRILDTARSVLKRGTFGEYIEFMLNKQAAFAGKVSFVTDPDESPMGPIRVLIRHPDPVEVIDWLAPKTSHGKPIWEKEMPSS